MYLDKRLSASLSRRAPRASPRTLLYVYVLGQAMYEYMCREGKGVGRMKSSSGETRFWLRLDRGITKNSVADYRSTVCFAPIIFFRYYRTIYQMYTGKYTSALLNDRKIADPCMRMYFESLATCIARTYKLRNRRWCRIRGTDVKGVYIAVFSTS